jgi:uncharacterized protein DUF4326
MLDLAGERTIQGKRSHVVATMEVYLRADGRLSRTRRRRMGMELSESAYLLPACASHIQGKVLPEEWGMILVVNIKKHIPDYTAAVYIGRKMPGRPASPLANLYKIKRESERPEALNRYRLWLEQQMQSDTPARAEIQRLAEIAKRTDLLLLCWCAPKPCHGDVVKEFIERIKD